MKEEYKKILLSKSMIPSYALLFISIAILILETAGFSKELGTPVLILAVNLFLALILILILIQTHRVLKEISGKIGQTLRSRQSVADNR